MFQIDEVSGLISTKTVLRMSTAAQYSFTVGVRDLGAQDPPLAQQTATGRETKRRRVVDP